jgi:hypothetical protein
MATIFFLQRNHQWKKYKLINKEILRKLFSILLIIVLLFNWFGYQLLIYFTEVKANVQLEAQLDEDKYDESQLVSIKIPVTYLPYYNNSKIFERINGQVEIRGVPYKYVKRRIYNDSLEMLCIPNHAAIKSQANKNEFFKFANDLQQEKKSGSHNGSYKIFSLGYYTANDLLQINNPPCRVSLMSAFYSLNISSRSILSEERPPKNC